LSNRGKKKSSNEVSLHLFLETLKKTSILTNNYVFLHSRSMYDVTLVAISIGLDWILDLLPLPRVPWIMNPGPAVWHTMGKFRSCSVFPWISLRRTFGRFPSHSACIQPLALRRVVSRLSSNFSAHSRNSPPALSSTMTQTSFLILQKTFTHSYPVFSDFVGLHSGITIAQGRSSFKIVFLRGCRMGAWWGPIGVVGGRKSVPHHPKMLTKQGWQSRWTSKSRLWMSCFAQSPHFVARQSSRTSTQIECRLYFSLSLH